MAILCALLLLQEPQPPAPSSTSSLEVQRLYNQVRDLNRRAETARAAGDEHSFRLLKGQAWWTLAELRERMAYEARLAGQVQEAAEHSAHAEQARTQARLLGYQPAVLEAPPLPGSPPPASTPPPPAFRPLGPEPSIWNYLRLEPHPFLRRNTYHAWVQQPRLEGAMTHPRGRYVLRASLDYAGARHKEIEGGGLTRYNGRLWEQTIQLDYAALDWLQVGGRIVTGELRAAERDRMTLFHDGLQQIRRDQRNWAIESLALRLKGTFPYREDIYFGTLAELKIPLFARSRDYLTGRQFDLGLNATMTHYWHLPAAGDLAVHLQLGVVFPLGESRLLRNDEDPNPFWTAGAALAWALHDFFSVGLQVEGQTSPWNQIDVLESGALTVSAFTKVQINRTTYLDFGLGFGLTDLSADLQASLGVTFTH